MMKILNFTSETVSSLFRIFHSSSIILIDLKALTLFAFVLRFALQVLPARRKLLDLGTQLVALNKDSDNQPKKRKRGKEARKKITPVR